LFSQLDLKLWVNTVNTVTALTQDTPVVLTDSVCLIPGGEPVVRLEDAPGNARREAQQGTAHGACCGNQYLDGPLVV